jgi:flagellar hook-basal body complex protein FliE
MNVPGLPLHPFRSLGEIQRLPTPAPLGGLGQPARSSQEVAPVFSELLTGLVRQTDAAQHRAEQMVESLALGEPVDVHQVMMALNEASHAVHLTLQVRGKLLEAYQDLMRMPM